MSYKGFCTLFKHFSLVDSPEWLAYTHEGLVEAYWWINEADFLSWTIGGPKDEHKSECRICYAYMYEYTVVSVEYVQRCSDSSVACIEEPNLPIMCGC